MAGISSKAAGGKENPYKYNGKELQHREFSDGNGIELYDFGARLQDPQLGRWNGVDPLSIRMPDISPYVYCFNNPYRYIDVNGMEGNDANGDDEMVHVRYEKNKKTGEITVTQISDEEYNNSTNGGTEHVVSFEKGDGDYVYANNSGSGMFQTKGYHGEKSQTEGENYNYVGHINWGKGDGSSNKENSINVAESINDYGVGALGTFGTKMISPQFIWGTAMNAQIEGKVLSNSTINLLEEAAYLTKTGKFAAKGGFWIGASIGIIKTWQSYHKEGNHLNYKVLSTGVVAFGSIAGGLAGTEGGAAIGAAIGVWFGGVGAIPGAIIGGYVGGLFGSWGGEKLGEYLID